MNDLKEYPSELFPHECVVLRAFTSISLFLELWETGVIFPLYRCGNGGKVTCPNESNTKWQTEMLKSGLLNKRQVCFPLSQTQQVPMRTISLHFPIFLDNPFRILSRGHDLVSASGVQILPMSHT